MKKNTLAPPSVTVFAGAAAEAELTRRGVPADRESSATDRIRRAVERGQVDANFTTGRALRSTAGTRAYHTTYEELAAELGPEWVLETIDQRTLLVNRKTRIAITTFAGDCDVGLVDGNPHSKNPKGKGTWGPAQDATQSRLDFGIPESELTSQGLDFYVVLYFQDNDLHEVRWELSRPTFSKGEGKHREITGFDNRAIGTAFPAPKLSERQPIPVPIVDVDVRRKSG